MSHTHLLRNVSLFTQISEDELDALSGSFLTQSYRRGQVVFQQGSITSSLYIVKSGAIQITSFGHNREVTYVGVYGPEQYFGEYSLIDGLPRSGEAVATANSDLLVLTRPIFFRFLETHPLVTVKLLVTVSRRVRFAESAVDHSAVRTSDEKIMRLLINIAERYPAEPPTTAGTVGKVRLGLRISSDDLAALSGVTRETAHEIVDALHRGGLIDVERTHILTVDISGMQSQLQTNQATV